MGIWFNKAWLQERRILAKQKRMDERFNKAVEFVLQWEGEYSNDIFDKGGETVYGVARTYNPDFFVGLDGLSSAEKKQKAIEWFRKKYWIPIEAEYMMRPFDLICFDTAVNLGPMRAILFLQKALKIKADGLMGPDTRRELGAVIPEFYPHVIRDFLAFRIEKYKERIMKEPKQEKFFHGWIRRTIDLGLTAMKDMYD